MSGAKIERESFHTPPQFVSFLEQLRKKNKNEKSQDFFEEHKYLIRLLGAIGVGTAAGLGVSAGVYSGDPSALFNKTNELLDLPEWASISMLVIALVVLCVIAYNADKSRMENIVIQQDEDLHAAYNAILKGFVSNNLKEYSSRKKFNGILESIACNEEPGKIKKQIIHWLKHLGIPKSQAQNQANSPQWWIAPAVSKKARQNQVNKSLKSVITAAKHKVDDRPICQEKTVKFDFTDQKHTGAPKSNVTKDKTENSQPLTVDVTHTPQQPVEDISSAAVVKSKKRRASFGDTTEVTDSQIPEWKAPTPPSMNNGASEKFKIDTDTNSSSSSKAGFFKAKDRMSPQSANGKFAKSSSFSSFNFRKRSETKLDNMTSAPVPTAK